MKVAVLGHGDTVTTASMTFNSHDVERELAWCHQERTYLGVYEDLIGASKALGRTGA